MAKPRSENNSNKGATPPPPRTTEGAPARPGSLLPDAKARDKSPETGATELPPVAGLSDNQWDPDTTPVFMDIQQHYGARKIVDVPVGKTTVTNAMNYFYEIRGKGTARGASKEDKQTWSNLLNSLRSYTNQELGTTESQANAFSQVLKYASRSNQPVSNILGGAAGEEAGFQVDGGGRGRIGAYAGPRASVSMANERDLRMTADAIASTVLGRAVTEDEFQKVLRQIRSAEQAEPSITTGAGAMTVSQAGLSAEGRKDIITETLMKGPEAKEFAMATTMMDAFYSALSEGPSGS